MDRRLAWTFLLLVPFAAFAQEDKVAEGGPRARVVTSVSDSARARLLGNTHPLARSEFDRGAAPADLPMQRMMVVLKRSPEQQKQLDQYLASVQDKNSPNYHRWLTPEEFGTRFGVAQADVDTVQAWLLSHGLQLRRVSNGRNIIEVSGTVAQVERAFHTDIRMYEVAGRQHYANDRDPEIPAALTPVVAGIATMHNFLSRGSAHVVGRGSGSRAMARTKPTFTFDHAGEAVHALVPADLQIIYNAAPLFAGTKKISGAGQRIAVAARSNIRREDFREFRALFQPFARQDALKVIVNGIDPGLTYDEDMLEATADVEYAGSLAPDADVLLIVSASTNDSDGIALSALYAVDNNVAPVLSVSYGACESALGTVYNEFYSSLWEQAAAQGITVAISSGDSGPAGCEQPTPGDHPGAPAVASQGPAVNGLASTPYNIAVGGTEFGDGANAAYWASQLDVAYGSALSYMPELAWNESCSPYSCATNQVNFTASSGGPSRCTASSVGADGNVICSAHYPKPAWQAGPGVPQDDARDLPDISLSAAAHDGYVVCFAGSCAVDAATGSFGFVVTGGTSLSAPTFGGVIALATQKTGSAQGQAAPVLYAMAASNASTSSCNASEPGSGFEFCAIRDVTKGNSDIPCAGGSPGCSETHAGGLGTLAGYAATQGYDMVTGLGSINVANLVNNWTTGIRGATQTTLSLSPLGIMHGETVSLSVSVTPQSNQGVPGGDVVLLTDSDARNSSSVVQETLTNGTFAGELSSLPGGTYHVFARYGGDSDFAPSVSPAVLLTVTAEGSKTELTGFMQSGSGLVPIAPTVPFGTWIGLNATATGLSGMGTATGSITFSATTSSSEAAVTQNLPLNNAGAVEAGVVVSSRGQYSLSATYSGDASLKPSTSGPVNFQVLKATPEILGQTTAANVAVDGVVQIHIALRTVSRSQITPSGTVRLMLGNTELQRAQVSGYTDETSGVACANADVNVSAKKLASGLNLITIVYEGDDHYNGASSPSRVSVNVIGGQTPGAAVKIDLSVTTPRAGTSAMIGDVIALRATVTKNSQPVTGGTVAFYAGLHPLGTVGIVGVHPAVGLITGTATLKTRLPSGTNSVTARYNGVGSTYSDAVSVAQVVTVNGKVRTETILSASENTFELADYDLTASVMSSSSVAPPGVVQFSNTNNTPLGQVALQASDVSFAVMSSQSLAIDDQLWADGVAVASADLNGDGVADAVTANSDDHSISVLLGDGDGTFKQAHQFAMDSSPTQVLILDVDQDGIPDVISATTLGTVSVLFGNGDGTFRSGNSYAVTDSAVALVQGDFNGDGIIDLAAYSGVSPSLFGSPCVFVLLGKGDGTFMAAQTYLSGEIVTGLATGDFNHDGVLDLASSGPTGIYILTGDGDGTFHLSQSRPYDGSGNYFFSQVSSPVSADFNQDGIPDLAISSDMVPYQTLVLLGNADGSFQSPAVLDPGFSYLETSIDEMLLTVADVNVDGIPDLVQMLSGISSGKTITGVYLYIGTGDGTFSSPTRLALSAWNDNSLRSISISDLNGDGLDDVLATTRMGPEGALNSALLQTVSTATLKVSLGNASNTIQASYVPEQDNYSPSTSNTLTLGSLLPTVSTLQYGYKNAHGNCSLGGTSSPLYWGAVPCFYLHVGSIRPGTATPTGTVTLMGSAPSGSTFSAGPYALYPDGAGDSYVYIFYNDGLGDAGDYTFRMAYDGDGNFQRSESSGTVLVSVQPLPTTTIVSGPSRLLTGGTGVFTIDVQSPIFSNMSISGSVSIYDGQNLLQQAYVHANSLVIAVPPLSPGTHNIIAQFDGLSGRFQALNAAASISAPTSVTVFDRNIRSSATVALVVAPANVAAGQVLSMTATVSDGGAAFLTKGTVTFFDGRTSLGTAILSGSHASPPGTATLKRILSVGKHAISARYDGLVSLGWTGAETVQSGMSQPQLVIVDPAARSDTSLMTEINVTSRTAYDLTSMVFAYGLAAPTGVVAFDDITANKRLGSVAVDVKGSRPGFTESKSLALNGSANSIVATDFNADGLTDLAVANASINAVHVLLQLPGGTYSSQTDYIMSGVPLAIATADLNADGIPDLVVTTADSKLTILLGNSVGTFQPLDSCTLPFAAARILLGDLNGDGQSDVVVTGVAGTRKLSVLLGNGDGTLGGAKEYTIPRLSDGYSLALQDLNSDGVLDLLLVTNNNATYEMLGTGDGTLQSALYFSAANGGVVSIDLNGDRFSDLAFAPATGIVAVQLGRGDGTFTPPRYYPSQRDSMGNPEEQPEPAPTTLPIAAADFDGDGVPDIIIPGMILLGAGDGTFEQRDITYDGSYSVLADANGDGVVDLVRASNGLITTQYGGTVVSALLANQQLQGTGTHSVSATFSPSTGVPYVGSTSTAVEMQAYETIPTLLTLEQTSPRGEATYGDNITITADVEGSEGGMPSGTVQFTVDGHPQGASILSSNATTTIVLNNLSGGRHTVEGIYGGSEIFSRSSGSNEITVKRAPASLSLMSSGEHVDLSKTVMFTAGVQGRLGTARPTGSIEFFDGSTPLGTANLDSSGVAHYATSALAAGNHDVSAVYSGDQNFVASTSLILKQAVTAPDFQLALKPSSIVVNGAQSGFVVISVTGVGGYSGAVTLACTDLPPQTTCSFQPNSVNITGANEMETSRLTIATFGGGAAKLNRKNFRRRAEMVGATLFLGFPMLLTGLAFPGRSFSHLQAGLRITALVSIALFGLTSCGGGDHVLPGSSPSSYSLAVRASSGTVSHTMQLDVVSR